MNCRLMQRRLSDGVDGELSPRRRRALDAHLAVCPACREYARRLGHLHEEARASLSPAAPPPDAADFARRLERLLQAESQPARPSFPAWLRWAVPAGLAAAAALALLLVFLPGRRGDREPGLMMLSMGSTVQSVMLEFSDDPAPDDMFDRLLLETLGGDLDQVKDSIGLEENPLLWDDLTPEELEQLEAELARDTKSLP